MNIDTAIFGFFGGVGPMEMAIIGIIAVLLFGKRLPEVGRSLGRGLTEFKKGINGVEDEIKSATRVSSHSYSSPAPSSNYEERDEATAPKFEPPPAESSLAPDEPQTN